MNLPIFEFFRGRQSLLSLSQAFRSYYVILEQTAPTLVPFALIYMYLHFINQLGLIKRPYILLGIIATWSFILLFICSSTQIVLQINCIQNVLYGFYDGARPNILSMISHSSTSARLAARSYSTDVLSADMHESWILEIPVSSHRLFWHWLRHVGGGYFFCTYCS